MSNCPYITVLFRLARLVPSISLTRSCCLSVGLAAVVECPLGLHTWRAVNLLETIFLGGTDFGTPWSFDRLLLLASDIEPNPGPQVSSTNRYPCVVCSTEVRNQGICCPTSVSLVHLNIRNILPKLNEISLLVSNHHPDVLTLSETWLDESICDAEVSLPGYNLLRQD